MALTLCIRFNFGGMQQQVSSALICAVVEHLACGAGLVNIYNFLRKVNPSGRPPSQLQQERDPPSIGMAAMQVPSLDFLSLLSCTSTDSRLLPLLGCSGYHQAVVLCAWLPYVSCCISDSHSMHMPTTYTAVLLACLHV